MSHPNGGRSWSLDQAIREVDQEDQRVYLPAVDELDPMLRETARRWAEAVAQEGVDEVH